MATGLSLIISSFCNATFCNITYDKPDYLDVSLTTQWKAELRRRAEVLNGKHLKVATYNNFPMSWVEITGNNTMTGNGVAFEVLDELCDRFNFTYEVVAPQQNFIYEVGGAKPEDCLIGLVNTSAVDMAVAFIPTLVKFRHRVRFSTSLDEGVWAMMLKRPRESATGTGLLAPFDSDVWYLTLAAVFGYVPCMALITHWRAKLIKDNEKEIPLSPSMWFVYSAFIKQSTTMEPEANTTRMLFATWWLFMILLSSFYTANLTAFLTLSKFTLDIKDQHDLYKMNYRWVSTKGGTIEYIVNDPEEEYYYLNKMVRSGRAEFREIYKDLDFLPLIDQGYVLVQERVSIDHLMYADYLKKTREGVPEAQRCTYVSAPDAFARVTRAFAYPHGSDLVDLFDPVLRLILQGGIINFLQIRDLPSTKMCPLDLQSKDRKLRNTDLLMTYLLMLIGLAAAIASFIGEILMKRRILTKTTKVELFKKKKSTKKFRFKDQYDSRPPPYDSLFGQNSTYRSSQGSKTEMVNGREYFVVTTINGDKRLIPVRTPSAFLYH